MEGLIGFFVNTLALRVEVSGATVSELLGRVKSQVLEAQAVERVRPVRSLSHSPVFQAALSWLNTEAVGLSLELEGLTIEGVDAGQAAAKFDLTLELRETSEGLAGSLDYATALFDRETIERYLGYLQRLLAAMVENDSQQVSRIGLLDKDERAAAGVVERDEGGLSGCLDDPRPVRGPGSPHARGDRGRARRPAGELWASARMRGWACARSEAWNW